MQAETFPFEEYSRMFVKARDNEGEFFMVQANLPDSYAAYQSGNGEGVWIIIDEADHADWRNDKAKGNFYGILCVPSLYHPELTARIVDQAKEEISTVAFEHRGDRRPVLAMSELEQLLGTSELN